VDIVEETVALPGRTLTLLRPRDTEALIDEAAFARNEFLPYWGELWPSGLELAALLAERPLAGVRVLELGCGLGVASIAAALAGAEVLATDWAEDAIPLVRENAARNGAPVEVALADWADPAPLLERAPWPLVVAADVLYEQRNGELLLELLPRLVDEGEVLLADPGRPFARSFRERARETWTVTQVADRVWSLRHSAGQAPGRTSGL
jgi:predicted nicotinamide N-methyase